MTGTTVRRAAGSLGRPCAATTRRRISAWRAPRPGLAVWSAWAARLAASCRAPVAGGPRDRPRGCPRGGRARVVVVARPVVRHTRPTADCRPAASGPSVSRSSSCACSPCGDPQTSGWFLTLRWWLPSGGWPRSGEWRLGWASLSRRGSACRARGIGLLRHADGEAGGAPRPPLDQPALNSRAYCD